MNIFEQFLRGTIICDACHRRFKQNLEDRPQPDGSVLRMFQCPHCGSEYHVARISPRGQELARMIQALPAADRRGIRRLQRELKREVARP